MNYRKELGTVIRLLRESLGWNQQELADEMELSQSQISRWESGVAAPDLFEWDHLKSLLSLHRVAIGLESCGEPTCKHGCAEGSR